MILGILNTQPSQNDQGQYQGSQQGGQQQQQSQQQRLEDININFEMHEYIDFLWSHFYVGEFSRPLLRFVLDKLGNQLKINNQELIRLIWCFSLSEMEDPEFILAVNQRLNNTSKISFISAENLFLLSQSRQILLKSQNSVLQFSNQLQNAINQSKQYQRKMLNQHSQKQIQLINDVKDIISQIGGYKIIDQNKQLRNNYTAQLLITNNNNKLQNNNKSNIDHSTKQKQSYLNKNLQKNHDFTSSNFQLDFKQQFLNIPQNCDEINSLNLTKNRDKHISNLTAVFIDSDYNFSVGQNRSSIGEALARNRSTQLYNYNVVVVDEKIWYQMGNDSLQKIEYLKNLGLS
eukprot:TRINITY_DN27785_c0_g1_i2.p1 TRINITY_DN27785_c0_g1~~TRINITY_DN27785_c0_g1_i2.p1  ORF type:complete len:346 (+),score=13.46 TRINITY_DN27785_c0_g1_i2:2-1039(+)